jgi:hypothetical protein
MKKETKENDSTVANKEQLGVEKINENINE